MIKTFSRGPQHFLPWQRGWIWHQLTQEVKNKICGQFKLPFQRFFNNLRLRDNTWSQLLPTIFTSFFRLWAWPRGYTIGSSLSWTVEIGRNVEANDDFIGPAMDVNKRGCFYFLYFLLWPRHTAYRILLPRPGIDPVPPAVEVQSLNHWTSKEVPERRLLKKERFQ